jgi:hypothetical protein
MTIKKTITPKSDCMKRTIIAAAMLTILSSGVWAQENTQSRQQREKSKSEMQQDDLNNNKKVKKDSTRKMNKSKKNNDEKSRRMDYYESTKQGNTGTPAEQRHMDSTINNHR